MSGIKSSLHHEKSKNWREKLTVSLCREHYSKERVKYNRAGGERLNPGGTWDDWKWSWLAGMKACHARVMLK